MFKEAGNLSRLQQLKVTDCAQLQQLPGDLGSGNAALELLHINGEFLSYQTHNSNFLPAVALKALSHCQSALLRWQYTQAV
jgi:hypothetical protein